MEESLSHATLVPDGVIVMMRRQGDMVFKKVEAVSDSHTPIDEKFFLPMGVKEIDGYTAEMLGQDVGRSATKEAAIQRFFRVAQKMEITRSAPAALPVQAPEAPRGLKKVLIFSFDPGNPLHVCAYYDLAPQGKACLLAGLGRDTIPLPGEQAVTNTVPYPILTEHLEAKRYLFDSRQPLPRILLCYRSALVAGGLLKVTGDGSGSTKATDKYIYSFTIPILGVDRRRGESIPPHATDVLRAVASHRGYPMGGFTVEVQGFDLRNILAGAKARGKFKTRRDPFRCFQYIEHWLIDAKMLQVRA